MADATTARSDDASRNEELRVQRKDTPIVTFARLAGQADAFLTAAGRESSRRKGVAFRAMHNTAHAAMDESYIGLLNLIPQGDDRDLMILAGQAAALTAISATLAAQWPAGADSIEPIFPELARSIRRDMAIVDALRADVEGR